MALSSRPTSFEHLSMNAEDLAHLKFENSARALRPRCSFSHSLYRTKLLAQKKAEKPFEHRDSPVSYPERNFGWNQLLDSSIGLSPLCPIGAMDLHVTTATGLHPTFVGLRPHQA